MSLTKYNHLSLHYHTLQRKQNEIVKEGMARLRHKATECQYDMQYTRQFKERYIHGMNDNTITTEIICGLMTTAESNDITSALVLSLAKRKEVQTSQSAVSEDLKDIKNFMQYRSILSFKFLIMEKAGKSKEDDKQAKGKYKDMCNYFGTQHQPKNVHLMAKHDAHGKCKHYKSVPI